MKTSKNISYNHAKIMIVAKDSFGIPKHGMDVEIKLAIGLRDKIARFKDRMKGKS